MYAKKHRPMQKLTAICLSVTIAAASLLSGHVFASDEAPQTDYLTGWELLAELREMGLGQDVIPDEEAPESDNSSETNTEDPSDTTGEPGDGDQTGGTEPGNPDGNNPGEGGSGEGDTDTDTDPGTDNPDNSDPAASTDPDEGDGAEQDSDQNQPSAPAESTEPASGEVPLVTHNDEMTVNDPQIPGETPASEEDNDKDPAPSDEETPSEDPGDDETTTTPGDDNTSQNPDENPGGETTTPPEGETGDNQEPSGGDEIDPGFGVDPSTPIEEIPETSGITEEQRAALEAYVQTLEAEQVVSLDGTDITAEEYDDLYSMLTSSQISDLYDYLNPPVSMTDVPSIFELYESQLPSVRPFSLPMKRNADALTDSPGLETTKTVTVDPTDPNQFNVTLEAYANGTETTVYTGLDIILVLDTSQNVKNEWMKTLKEAVNGFIESVVEESQPDNPHRIAAVEFGYKANLLWGSAGAELLDANNNNFSVMQDAVSDLQTQSNAKCMLNTGVERAEDIVFRLAEEDQPNRKTVVIIFASDLPKSNTDNEEGWNFAHTTATKAVQSANDMKQMGATIYTIGVYEGVDPDELYGSGIYRQNYETYGSTKDVECEGHSSHVNAQSGNNRYKSEWGNNNSYENPLYRDIPTANRMMNLMSSNFNYSLTIGEKGLGVAYHNGDDSRKISYEGVFPWLQYSYTASTIEITQEYRFEGNSCNVDPTVVYGQQNGFFAGTEKAEDLEKIFENLSQSVGGSAIELDENAVLKDVVTPYFDIVGDVSAYSVDESGEKQETFTPAVDGDTITVSGFDYKAHYIGTGSTDPQKLVVTFTIERKDEFLGGNAVPTNGDASGVYSNEDDASDPSKVVENFPRPSVNVPIHYSFNVTDKTIYLSQSQKIDFAAGGVFHDNGRAAKSLGGDAKANDYVNITYTVTDSEGKVGTYTITPGTGVGSWGADAAPPELTPEDCEELVITCTVKSKNKAAKRGPLGNPGEAQDTWTPEPGDSATKTATVHVLKPTLNFKDTYEDGPTNNYALTENQKDDFITWSDFETGHTNRPDPTQNEPADESIVLTYTWMEKTGTTVTNATVNLTETANFKVEKITIGTKDYTSFEVDSFEDGKVDYRITTYCNLEGVDSADHLNGRHFTVHLPSEFDLTITKNVPANYVTGETFRFTVESEENDFYAEFTLGDRINAESADKWSITLTGLKPGEYTITEDTGWSWRYDCTDIAGGGTEVNKNITTGTYTAEFNDDATVTYTNVKDNPHWLSWEDTKVNIFNPAS